MKSCYTTLLAANRQFFLYCLIGLSGVTLDFLMYASLLRTSDLHVQLANAVSYACGTGLSFVLNARINFKTRDRIPLRFAAFCAVAAVGWATSGALLHVTIVKLGIDKYVAKALSISVVVLLQYNLNRLVSFRKPRTFAHG
jgi:putative flippase GtrA